MRWSALGEEWLCDRIAGHCQAIQSDGRTGRLTLRGSLSMREGLAIMRRDPDAEYHQVVEGMSLPSSFWRVCYHREGSDFRLRDELAQTLRFVKGYVGDLHLSWRDAGSHIFHTGHWVIDENNLAHCYE